jgi:hypothetical protein
VSKQASNLKRPSPVSRRRRSSLLRRALRLVAARAVPLSALRVSPPPARAPRRAESLAEPLPFCRPPPRYLSPSAPACVPDRSACRGGVCSLCAPPSQRTRELRARGAPSPRAGRAGLWFS